jgi:hypothetical protein
MNEKKNIPVAGSRLSLDESPCHDATLKETGRTAFEMSHESYQLYGELGSGGFRDSVHGI